MAATESRSGRVAGLVPGLLLVLLLAATSTYVNVLYPPLSAVAVAIVSALLLSNTIGMPQACRRGQEFAVNKVLPVAIVLLGARLNLSEVAAIGGKALIVILACIVAALFIVRTIGARLGLPDKLTTLIAVGTSICGISAIVATAPAIDAEDDEISYSVAVMSLFGLLALILYPLIGAFLNLSDTFFGLWAGTAINDTSQVVAAGFLYSESAGQTATVAKLARNLFMAPVILLMSALYARKQAQAAAGSPATFSISKAVPWFVVGFLCMGGLRSMDVFSADLIAVLKTCSDFLIVTALAGVGLSTRFSSIKRIGLQALCIGLFAAVLVSLVSFSLLTVLDY